MGKNVAGKSNGQDLASMCLADVGFWAETNKLILSSGSSFGFKDHEYLMEPYQMLAQAPVLVGLKGSQLGWSEMCVLAALHGAAFLFGTGVIYYFPTDFDVTRFSKARFSPLLQNNPNSLGPMVRTVNDVHTKRINGKSFLYFLGANSSTSTKTTAADCLFFDEIDEADPYQVEQAHERVSHSPFKWYRYLSTPTLPDIGVDEKFQRTDRRHRMIYCEGCRKYTCLETSFPDCIHETQDGLAYRACIHCGQRLNLGNPKNEWVPEKPGALIGGRPAVGYWISQLQSPHVDLQAKWEAFKRGPKHLGLFYNHFLAQAYAEAADRLEVEQVLALCKGFGMEHFSDVPSAIGIDVGPKALHVVVLRPEVNDTFRILWLGEVRWDETTNWGELDQIMKRFRGRAVIDSLGEPERTGKWVVKYRNRAWACTYSKRSSMETRWSAPNDSMGTVTVYQDTAMTRSHRLLQEGKTFLPRVTDKVREFAEHCHSAVRKKVINEETGQFYYTWVKTRNEDHYRRAFNFAVLAAEKTRMSVTERPGRALLRPASDLRRDVASHYASSAK